ncbi:MAG: MmcQ/YjbR family DNA-binding protein [Gemmatimonadetes bacterium]|nr:MmcQ/YjbR family DNA-binding protein [Gemmatimonadota bacterium]MBT8404616.1 MmcQ/YjbR family DNA-binding protein [Gemmatimonadota bacterium]NNF39114.1 MmcQ/YjbR family DNA-binding protein [Gemmatimonadota bacterium]NNK61611.1 MmcQ/YjbR family DNA-binding protein [Gemmatimonadota bacterium]
MTHPRMYTDDDFGLAELREICFSLPEVVEKEAHGHPSFRTKKMFAIYGGMTKGAGSLNHPFSVLVKMPPAGIRVAQSDARFFTPAYYGPSGWVGLDLTVEPLDWELVRDLVTDSYRATAPRSFVARLEG